MKKYALILIAFVMVLSACGKKDSFDAAAQAATDDAAIQAYISTNKLTNVVKDASGVYYQIITVGTGVNATGTSYISVNYNGKFLDGSQFDAGTLTKTPLSTLVLGWQFGIPYSKVGGRILLLVPSALGYGHNPSNGFRSDAVTIFTIDLTAVQ